MTRDIHPDRRCVAHRADGSGRRCDNYAIKGGKVCHVHGGRAPQVKRAAKERLLALAEPAVKTTGKILRNRNLDPAVRLRAAVVILDRAGLHAKSGVDVKGSIEVERIFDVDCLPLKLQRQMLQYIESQGDGYMDSRVVEISKGDNNKTKLKAVKVSRSVLRSKPGVKFVEMPSASRRK